MKKVKKLKDAAPETHTQLLGISGIFTVRWVASSFSAVRAVWRNYVALFLMFQTAEIDCKHASADRAKFHGIAENYPQLPLFQTWLL
jgi:hypothetical protein